MPSPFLLPLGMTVASNVAFLFTKATYRKGTQGFGPKIKQSYRVFTPSSFAPQKPGPSPQVIGTPTQLADPSSNEALFAQFCLSQEMLLPRKFLPCLLIRPP